ncbi:MAG: methyltransferase domain-containing protein [Acutalibacteraceae bacterium]|nr:methyltransferase domain-containing protein [Acutalibacteraceae bacterium]
MKTNIFYKFIASVYDLLDVIYFRNYNRSPRKAVIEAISENDKILDLCTGTATNAIGISKAIPTSEIVGVDLSENMLKVAREKLKKSNIKNITLYQMDATKLSFKSESFDKILLSLILHEMDEELRSKILSEAKRASKKDGRIIITEWERSSKLSQRLLFMPIHLLEPKPYREFINKDLYTDFTKHGLQIEEYIHCDYTRVIILKPM